MTLSSVSTENLQKLSLYLENPIKNNLEIEGLVGTTRLQSWKFKLYRFFRRPDPQIEKIIRFANRCFALAEREGIEMDSQGGLSQIDKDRARAHIDSYKNRLETHLTIYEKIEGLFNQKRWHSKGTKREFHHLQQQLIGLRYRIGRTDSQAEAGLKKLPERNEAVYNQLYQWAQAWKQKQKFGSDKGLNAIEMLQLERATKYQEWVKFLEDKPHYRTDFFNHALRDFGSVSLFIRFPQVRQELKKALIINNLGRMRRPKKADRTGIRTYAKLPGPVMGTVKKVPVLKFYDGDGHYKQCEEKRQRLVDLTNLNQEIYFTKGNYHTTLREVLKEFSQKKLKEPNFITTAYGICHDNPVKGLYDADKQAHLTDELKAAMTEDNWLEYVPPSELVTEDFLKQKFPGFDTLIQRWSPNVNERRQVFYSFAAARQEADSRSLNCHAFLRIYVRREDGLWEMKEPGLYANEFQQSLWDGLKKFGGTLGRVFCRQDQNASYTHRQQAEMPIFPSKDKCTELTREIYNRFIAEEGVFQFAGVQNCTGSLQEVFEKVFEKMGPRLVETYSDEELLKQDEYLYQDPLEACGVPDFSYIDVAQGSIGFKPLDKILAFIGRQDRRIQKIAVPLLAALMGGARSYTYWDKEGNAVTRSLLKSYQDCYCKHKRYILPSPARLHTQIEEAKKNAARKSPFKRGVLWSGNTELHAPHELVG